MSRVTVVANYSGLNGDSMSSHVFSQSDVDLISHGPFCNDSSAQLSFSMLMFTMNNQKTETVLTIFD
jgi:hypothetical protein